MLITDGYWPASCLPLTFRMQIKDPPLRSGFTIRTWYVLDLVNAGKLSELKVWTVFLPLEISVSISLDQIVLISVNSECWDTFLIQLEAGFSLVEVTLDTGRMYKLCVLDSKGYCVIPRFSYFTQNLWRRPFSHVHHIQVLWQRWPWRSTEGV